MPQYPVTVHRGTDRMGMLSDRHNQMRSLQQRETIVRGVAIGSVRAVRTPQNRIPSCIVFVGIVFVVRHYDKFTIL